MRLALKLLAPYLAVGVFWCVFGNAWFAILAYHFQILIWSRDSLKEVKWSLRPGHLWIALPAALAGPLLFFLLPYIAHTELSTWLVQYHLSGAALVVMIPYFGFVHPLLEQMHWAPLRRQSPVAHLAFAGYHMLVLYSLLTLPWLIISFVVLATASFAWRWMTEHSGGLAVPVLSHVLADLGIIVAAWMMAAMIS